MWLIGEATHLNSEAQVLVIIRYVTSGEEDNCMEKTYGASQQ